MFVNWLYSSFSQYNCASSPSFHNWLLYPSTQTVFFLFFRPSLVSKFSHKEARILFAAWREKSKLRAVVFAGSVTEGHELFQHLKRLLLPPRKPNEIRSDGRHVSRDESLLPCITSLLLLHQHLSCFPLILWKCTCGFDNSCLSLASYCC